MPPLPFLGSAPNMPGVLKVIVTLFTEWMHIPKHPAHYHFQITLVDPFFHLYISEQHVITAEVFANTYNFFIFFTVLTDFAKRYICCKDIFCCIPHSF